MPSPEESCSFPMGWWYPQPCSPPAWGSCSGAAGQGRAGGTGDAWHTPGCPHQLLHQPHHHALTMLDPPPFNLPSPAPQMFRSPQSWEEPNLA